MRSLLLLSNSKVFGGNYLEYASQYIQSLLTEKNVKQVLFVPYALKDHDSYTQTVYDALNPWGFTVEGIHKYPDPVRAVEDAQAIFIGGGNTFRLLKTLYDNKLIDPIRKRVLKDGIPYIGSSAGTNVATCSINTTNDMPIVYPPSFEALNLVPFNINPHYIDPQPDNTHMGETREQRINEYHEIPGTPPVVGLREGSLLKVNENEITLCGTKPARLFYSGKEPVEYPIGSDLSFLLG